uniref:Integral membrane protein n=1 Tax=Streptomyces sp. NBC_00049 TaxID=2903617 RepID=A0AAU2JN85_9ACTN
MERHVAGMLQQIARQQDIVEIAPQGTAPKAAALAHVAEQYGYTYGTAYRTGFKNSLVQVRMYRDPRPDARVREAATITAHPQAGNGGTVPGLGQGSLKPLPEAVGAVAVLKDLITFDVMALYVADRSLKVKCYLACAVLTGLMLIDESPVEAFVSGGVVALLLTVAFKVGVIRRGKITQRLTAAGFLAVRDEQGRRRFLGPGQQLPGHANPFAA